MAEFNPCLSEQDDEILALSAIFGDDFSTLNNEECGAIYKLKIKVNLVGKKVQFCAWLPAEDDTDTPEEQETQDGPSSPVNKITFKRSESKQHSCLMLSVSHLTPLTLEFSFPSSYPTSAKPLYTLSCLWLDVHNLGRLCEKLDELCDVNCGEATIFPWVDWLQNSSLEYLGAYECINIKPYAWVRDEDGLDQDPRALTEFLEPKSSALAILHYDFHKDQQQFRQENHVCEICFEEREGIFFHFLQECGHKFCVECLLDYCQMHVRDGTVRQLLCPENQCKESLSPMILRELLSNEDFDRWERLLFEQTLDGMLDVLYCPRCNSVVIQDEDIDSKLAQCHHCFFSFCTECQSSWHSTQPCGSEDDETAQTMPSKKKSRRTGKKRFGDDENNDDSDDDDGVVIGKKKSKNAMQKSHEFLMLQKRLGNYQRCPKCRIMVERTAGCDMMHCSRCGQSFCWTCGHMISGYDHFQECREGGSDGDIQDRGRAMLNRRPVAEAVTRMKALAEDFPTMQMKLKKCPRCGQKNMKEHRNNHVKCWSCKLDFCYQCSKPTGSPVSIHFNATSTCKQHSDD